MSIQDISFYSNALHKESKLQIYCPDVADIETPLPVLYFLHGRSGDETVMTDAGIAETADALIKNGEIKPLIIVCPRMENSRGINSSTTCKEVPSPDNSGIIIQLGRYEDYVLQDVLPFVEANFPVCTDRAGRYIGGASAGGYAALHHALRHPDLFSKVGGHMPALELTLAPEDAPYFSSTEVWNQYDPITIAKHNDITSDLQVYLDAGDEDEGQFYKGCSILHDILQSKGVHAQNHVYEGHHNVAYIRNNMREYLTFYAL